MQYAAVKDVLTGQYSAGETVTVRGWVRTRRDSKAGISFVNVHDGSCFDAIQAVVPSDLDNYSSEVQKLTTGCSVAVTGTVAASAGQGQDFELQASSVHVYGWVEDPDTYPMAPKRHSMEYLREFAHLRPRTNVAGAVTRVRHCLAQAVHRFFHQHGYYWISTPIITTSDAEGAGELFRVSTLDMQNIPKDDKGQVDYSQDFFWQRGVLDGVRST